MYGLHALRNLAGAAESKRQERAVGEVRDNPRRRPPVPASAQLYVRDDGVEVAVSWRRQRFMSNVYMQAAASI